jgi:hypothetical protein
MMLFHDLLGDIFDFRSLTHTSCVLAVRNFLASGRVKFLKSCKTQFVCNFFSLFNFKHIFLIP